MKRDTKRRAQGLADRRAGEQHGEWVARNGGFKSSLIAYRGEFERLELSNWRAPSPIPRPLTLPSPQTRRGEKGSAGTPCALAMGAAAHAGAQVT